jgi:hypothetical protein
VWMDVMYVCMYVCVFIRLQAASPQFWLGSSYPGRRCPRGEEATPLLRPPSGIRKKTVCTVVRCPGKGSFQHLRRMGGQPCALGLHFAVRGASRKPSFPFCHPELRAGTERARTGLLVLLTGPALWRHNSQSRTLHGATVYHLYPPHLPLSHAVQ